MLCYALLCYAMRCDAMRCDAMRCDAMLRHPPKVRGDAYSTGLPPSTIDVAVADLPFGMRHARYSIAYHSVS